MSNRDAMLDRIRLAVAAGADLLLIGSAAVMLGWAAVLKIQGSRLTTTR